MVNPNHITPYGEIAEDERELADDLVFNRREDALERFIAHFESKGEEAEAEAADPTAGMEPEEALHFHILRRKRDGVEDQIDRAVEKIGAVPTLNDVLLPAMKEVGDKFGAGELILPFVLQSAEVMKRAVAQLENYLDKIEGYTKGTVVLATVFGDVHDIGKSLVNTILTNNGYTVVDLGKQVPIRTILDAAKEHDATAIGLQRAARLDLEADAAVRPGAAPAAASSSRCSSAARRSTATSACARCTRTGRSPTTIYEPGVFYCKDAFEGLHKMDQIVDGEARDALVAKTRGGAQAAREGPRARGGPTDDDSVRSARAPTPRSPSRRSGASREVDVDMDGVFHHLDTHVLFKLHWGGRGVKGEAWEKLVDEDFRPRLERMWREQDYLHPRAVLGYFPCYSEGNEVVVLDPEDRETVLERSSSRASPSTTASAWPTSTARRTAASSTSSRSRRSPPATRSPSSWPSLERDGEFAEQLFTHGLGVQTAEGMAEWLHARGPRELGIPRDQGRRYSWGYPACPSSPSTRRSSGCSTRRRSACG